MKKIQVSEIELRDAIQSLYHKTQKFKKIEEQFKCIKSECTQTIDEYFNYNQIDEYAFEDDKDESMSVRLVAKKVQRSSVKFDAEKIEKVLEKNFSKDIVEKTYIVNDFPGLVSYLKSCGVNPKIFKSFIEVKKSVNQAELERLEQIGKISLEDLEGCFTVNKAKPYYTVKAGKENGE